MFAILTVVALLLHSASAEKLPESMPRCSRSDPNFNTCLKNAIQTSLPTLAKGIPKLRMLPIDPLEISSLRINQGTGPVAIDLTFENVLIKGISKGIVTSFKADLENYKLYGTAKVDNPVELEADYETKGTVLILPLVGKGKCYLKFDNLNAEFVFTGKELKKNGKSYFDLMDLKVKLKTTRLHMNFENLFSQNKAIGDNLNEFLNENWQDIFQELYPAIEAGLGAAFKEIASKLFLKVPLDEIFLP